MITTMKPEMEIESWDAFMGGIVALSVWAICWAVSFFALGTLKGSLIGGGVIGGLVSLLIGGLVWVSLPSKSRTFNVPMTRNIRILKSKPYIMQCRFMGKWYDVAKSYSTEDESTACAELINAYRDMRLAKRTKSDTEVVYSGRV